MREVVTPEIAELNERMHQFIVSGDFRAWRKRMASLVPTAPEPMRAASGRPLARCSYKGCKEFYHVVSSKNSKRTTYCRKHALAEREKKRKYQMRPCAWEGCDHMIYFVTNRSGYCGKHARRVKKARKKKNREKS